MKDKILMLIIGVLLGAIIATGCFMVFNSGKSSDNANMPQGGKDMSNFTPGEKPEGMPGDSKDKTNNTVTNQNALQENSVQ